jgi:hypothetical protein
MNSVKKYLLKAKVIFLAAIITGCTASPELGNYKMQMITQMQQMNVVLFAGHYNEFMSTYVNPSYIKSMGGVEQALLQFDNDEQQRLYADLKIAQNITPFYDPDKNELVYTGTILPKAIVFKQINGKWYMQGDWFKN